MLVGIVGFIGSGKGTVGDFLVENHGFKQDQIKASDNTLMKINDFDYLVTQYSQFALQKCMVVAINNITEEGHELVYSNPTMVVFKVKK